MSGYARTSEHLWWWLLWEEHDESAYPNTASWVGPDPRLAVADEDYAYAEILTYRPTGWIEAAPIVFFSPATIDENTYVRVQARSQGGAQQISVVTAANDGSPSMLQYADVPADEWVTVDFPTLASWAVDDGWESDYAGIVAAAPSEGFCVYVIPSYFGTSEALDVSLIEVLGARDRPLRWKQRDDGLGTYGVPAARGRTSAQRTNRAGPRSYY